MDEASFNSFMYQRKTWSYTGSTVEVPINSTRYSVTALASIGDCLKLSYCVTFGANTTSATFLEHLKSLKLALRNPEVRPILILDNARSHHAREVTQYLHTHFRPLFLPPYSPAFNNFEFVWGLAKPRAKSLLVED